MNLNYFRKFSKKWWDNLIAWSIENPLETWWKARKYFKFPKIKISFSTNKWSFPYASKYWQGKILDINIHDIFWKDKYSTPRHECNPLIYICLFQKFSLWITFGMTYKDELNTTQNGSGVYWEYILEWLYYKNKETLNCYSTWTTDSRIYKHIEFGEDESKDTIIPCTYTIPCVAMSLNKEGIKELKKELSI